VGRFVKTGDQIRIEATIHDAKREPTVVTATAATERDVIAAAQELARARQ